MKRKALFITGATGFIGSNLAERLEEEMDCKIFVLARCNRLSSAEERIKNLLPNFNGEVINGDICFASLGLSDGDLENLKDFELEIWHIAGNVSFDDSRSEDIFRVNLGGTENVLKFMEKMGAKRLHYISTAYIAGDRRGLGGIKEKVAFENEDFVGQKFHNSYEESKFKAEMLVKRTSSLLNLETTVYRISVAVGDSKTGKTSTFNGYYSYMHKLEILKRRMEKGDRMNYLDGVRIKIPSSAIVNIAFCDF